MKDGLGALQKGARPKLPARRGGGTGDGSTGRAALAWREFRRPLYRSAEPHHRRRRAVALSALAIAALVLGVAVGAGSGHTAPAHALGSTGFFGRITLLAGQRKGSFAASEKAAETAAIDRTLAYTPYVRVAGAQHREVALTFDDGPGPYTPDVLSILEREQVPATFFEVGVLEHYFGAYTARIVADGDPIGDHTMDHAPMGHLSRTDQQQQLLQQTAAIGNHDALFPRLFRPPYGLWNHTTLAVLHKYRMLMVLWTVDTSDYRLPGVSTIVHSVLAGLRPGAIILMHDAGGNRVETVQALPLIIKALRARGYKLVTVPRLLLDNPAPASQGVVTGLNEGGG